ncbi:MAG TPA: prepilin-type N-terminal cleavage/methylation domain-containing protein [Candidatus Acidoferrales bacterium]|nr:prepilin-type N-terminal cleavage/methylation domain-containing protein [Candidatus Acidoferrales bacterium]
MNKFSIFNFQFSKSKGFTLIELLLVIAIIGVLSSFIIANLIGAKARARDAQRKSDMRQIQSALELYRADQNTYPTAANVVCGQPLQSGGAIYMQKIPCDPLNRGQYLYHYTVNGAGTTYTIIACLENTNDQQKDKPSNNSTYCAGGTTNWSFTVTNP